MPFALNTIRGKCQTIKRQLAESSRVPAAANQKARGPEKGVASYVKALLNVSSACQRGWNGTRNQEKGAGRKQPSHGSGALKSAKAVRKQDCIMPY